VIAAVLLLEERSVSEIVPALTAAELEQVIKLVGRSPRCHPPGTLGELKQWKSSLSPPLSHSAPTNLAAKEQSGRTPVAHQPRQEGKRLPTRISAPGDAPPRAIERGSDAGPPWNTQCISKKSEKSGTPTGTAAETARATERGNSASPPWNTERIGKKSEKSGTSTGTVAVETARRRVTVEDLMKAGLSVRMISDVTGIPRSSVHRATRAIARAEAKKEVAIIRIASELQGQRLAHRGRATRTSKKRERTTPKASKTGHGHSEGSPKKLAEDFFAELDRSWEQHGHKTLEQVRTERPELYFKTLAKLTLALHRVPSSPNDFDRQRIREDILQRLEQRRV